MPPKNKPSGYAMFMQAERERIKAETKQSPSMQEMVTLCSEAWKNMTVDERARYNAMAKKGKGVDPSERDKRRLDNQGQNISERQLAAKEVSKRRTQENQLLVESWKGKDLLDISFHVINFQVMYIEDQSEFFLPLEVGLVGFTLREGITKHMHHFIDPGDVPQGNMHQALKHSENTHRIPLNFKEADSNFYNLWTRLERFVVADPQRDEIPPIFCLTHERKIVESCLEFMHYHARTGESNMFTKIYTLEDLVLSLLLQSGKVNLRPSETQIQDSLLRNQWDYISNIRCSYHDEVDCSYCSLAIVRRVSFALFDMLANILDFKLKPQHMPDEVTGTSFTVLRPDIPSGANGRGRGKAIPYTHRGNEHSSPRRKSTSPPSFVASSQPSRQLHTPGGVWGTPRVNKVEVTLSESSSSESDDDSDEIKTTTTDHDLMELRKPKLPAAVLPQSFPVAGQAYGRGLTLTGNRAFSPGVMGNQLRGPSSFSVPPGFGPRPGLSAGSVLQASTRPAFNIPQSEASTTQPAHNRGWETTRGRGRGMPRQA